MLPSSLLVGENAAYIDEKFQAWIDDPQAVEPVWDALFREAVGDHPVSAEHFSFPAPDGRSIFAPGGGQSTGEHVAEAHRQAGAAQLINAWRVRGHFLADIDPLGRRKLVTHPELTLEGHNLHESDLDVELSTGNLVGIAPVATLREIVAHLKAAYAGSIGVEYMNIDNPEQKRWVQEAVEGLPGRVMLDKSREERVLRKLSDAEAFEQMLNTRFPGTKRFSLEGGETLIPLLDMMISELRRLGAREIIMGMAHRGRLNVLVNTLEKPPRRIVEEFEDSKGPTHGSGDVKYHLGYSSDVITAYGDTVHLSLTPNPSHLEVVNSVVEGRVRAKQDRVRDPARNSTIPVLIHGDAAFVGQGSVMEVLQLSELNGYRTGGTIHVLINNQIGFTTAPVEGRSTNYATDIARMMAIPIFHVNGEDPQAVAAVVDMATRWRMRFHRDVVIDMYCYRKYGHNEGDEPSFTQPLMYKVIRARKSPRENYANRLVQLGHLSKEDCDKIYAESRDSFEARASDESATVQDAISTLPTPLKPEDSDVGRYTAPAEDALVNADTTTHLDSRVKDRWGAYTSGHIDDEVDTGVPVERLRELLLRANTVPDGFNVHNKIKRLLKQRLESVEGDRPLDWALGEQAAFTSLAAEGWSVRLSGQDTGRGTFSHRHAVWTDIQSGEEYFPLAHIEEGQAPCSVLDSSLSEFAALGYEVGYSMDTPDGLIMWEAQFGDFANGAQVVIDQYITSMEQKWGRYSGIVMLLPHAYEGQGPEHSSARIERYLLQCAQDNIQVANCTTPANLFHILRRQLIRNVRKPLILMTPKSLLRHPKAVSRIEELANGGFQRVISDPRALAPRATRRVVLCSGHVYYALLEAQESREGTADDIAIHRVELLYPFPAADITARLDGLKRGTEVVWCQEEPENMGPWPVLSRWLEAIIPQGCTLRYAGRPATASPATGSHHKHQQEQDALLQAALD